MSHSSPPAERVTRSPPLWLHALLFLLFNAYFGSAFGLFVMTGFSLGGMLALVAPLLFLNAIPSIMLWLLDLLLMRQGAPHWLRALSIIVNLPALAIMMVRAGALAGIDGDWSGGALAILANAVLYALPAGIITAIIAIRFWPFRRRGGEATTP